MRRNYALIALAAVLLASGSAPAGDQGPLVSWEALAHGGKVVYRLNEATLVDK